MTNKQRKLGVWVSGLFFSFIALTLLGGFIVNEMDPMEWDAFGRFVLVSMWAMFSPLVVLTLEEFWP